MVNDHFEVRPATPPSVESPLPIALIFSVVGANLADEPIDVVKDPDAGFQSIDIGAFEGQFSVGKEFFLVAIQIHLGPIAKLVKPEIAFLIVALPLKGRRLKPFPPKVSCWERRFRCRVFKHWSGK